VSRDVGGTIDRDDVIWTNAAPICRGVGPAGVGTSTNSDKGRQIQRHDNYSPWRFFMRDDEVTERCHGYQNYFSSLWTRPPNRTTLEARIQTSARSSRQPCLTSHRCAPPVQRPPTTGNSSALVGVMSDELGVANSNVTSEVTG
jgi:hypothetical protein